LLLCKLAHGCGANPFLSQQLVSTVALVVSALALYKTFAIEVGTSRPGFAPALAVTTATLAASYYLRLFSIFPEVFLLNIGLISLQILAITRLYHSANATNLGVVFLIYGLGLSHHHTLAFTLPGFAYLLFKKRRSFSFFKALSFAIVGAALGCLPLLYLFRDTSNAPHTYYRIHDLDSFLFVLLRKGYGTLKLSPLQSSTDLSGLFSLTFDAIVKNYNYLGLVVLAPLVLSLRPLFHTTNTCNPSESSAAPETPTALSWFCPSLLMAWSTFLVFFVLFIPNCNLELGVRTYRFIFLRFVTIPCFLSTYFVFKASLDLFDWSTKYGPRRQYVFATTGLLCVFSSTYVTYDGLRYRHCDLLDEHIRQGFKTIFVHVDNEPSIVTPNHRKCAIFVQGDTLLMGVKYYNDFVLSQKCYVYSSTSLSGQFLSRDELKLASSILGVKASSIEAGELATHPEALFNLFLKLDQQRYSLFVFSVTDFTSYFEKSFGQSPFAYRPVGNVLQVITQNSPPSGMDQMFSSYESYVGNLEAYLERLQQNGVPSEVADSQANQALILNLADYAKFTPYYPVAPQTVAQLNHRASAVLAQWQALMPHE
jgi:hypothetical protein